MKLSYMAQVRDGKLHIPALRRQQMAVDVAKLKEGRYVEIELRPMPRRSDRQSGYYWSVVVPEITDALKALGHETDHDTTHELLKSKFNSRPICNADGEVIGELPQTTTRLNITEFSEYIERIVRWAAQFLGLVIPPPNSQTEMFGE